MVFLWFQSPPWLASSPPQRRNDVPHLGRHLHQAPLPASFAAARRAGQQLAESAGGGRHLAELGVSQGKYEHYVHIYIYMFLYMYIDIGIYWNILEYIGIYWNMLEYIGIYYIGIYWNILEHVCLQYSGNFTWFHHAKSRVIWHEIGKMGDSRTKKGPLANQECDLYS